MSNKKKNFWPQSIAALLMAAALLLIWTVVKTSTMPVHEENSFMHAYQEVDLNSNEIITQNNKFFSKYDIVISSDHQQKELEGFYKQRNRTTNYVDKANPVVLEVTSNDGSLIESASMEVILSRPTSTADDSPLEVQSLGNASFEVDLSAVEKPGRWQLVIKAEVNNITGYKNIDLYLE